jgi:hypothetical protein
MCKHRRPRLGTEGVVGVLPDQTGDDQHITIAPALSVQPEVRPIGRYRLADALRELAVILPSLRAALDRQTAAGLVEPLLTRRDLARALRVSLPLLDRLRSAGRLPKPDVVLSRSPRWRVQTFRAWLEKGGRQ